MDADPGEPRLRRAELSLFGVKLPLNRRLAVAERRHLTGQLVDLAAVVLERAAEGSLLGRDQPGVDLSSLTAVPPGRLQRRLLAPDSASTIATTAVLAGAVARGRANEVVGFVIAGRRRG